MEYDIYIYAHFEIKVKNKWLHYSCPEIKRDHRLFAKMAGMHSSYYPYIKPISEPRGLPKDVSEVTAIESSWWGSDGHSHSWLNAKEIKEVILYHLEISDNIWMVYREWGYLHGNGWHEYVDHPSLFPYKIDDIRLVFWFVGSRNYCEQLKG